MSEHYPYSSIVLYYILTDSCSVNGSLGTGADMTASVAVNADLKALSGVRLRLGYLLLAYLSVVRSIAKSMVPLCKTSGWIVCDYLLLLLLDLIVTA